MHRRRARDADVARRRREQGRDAHADDGPAAGVSPPGESADALGPVLGGRWLVYATERAVWAVPTKAGDAMRLATLVKGATAVAVDPAGRQAIVAERDGDVEQLRAVRLRAPIRPSSQVRQSSPEPAVG